ncbi:TerD family protein [Spirillospora albida]|uniref:TerD family protein n=1 Tax=Spirillospora albida TaxID=58123 RepID=UPI0004C05844|nr:TerD family protein [Spirillospora albida]
MPELSPGANAALPARRVTATVACAAPVDVSALLVGADLRVRSDADLVFFNAPEAPGVRWSDGGGQRVDLDVDAVPPDVQAVLIAVSLTGSAGFGTVPPPRIRLSAGSDPVASFTAAGLGEERAIIGLEVYRRAGSWKVRAVGQGYAGGLAELLEAHGVDVDDPGEEAAPPPPPGPGAGQAAARGAPPPSSSEVGYLERCWLVWEDASRSLAAFRSSTEHALNVRNDEVGGRAPRGRFDQLMAAADQRLRADAAQLREELARVEPHVGVEAAPFDAPAWLTWRPRTDVAEGVLLGWLSTAEMPDLRVPLVLRMPWRGGMWISRGPLPGDAAAYAWSLVTRFMAAVPPGLAGLDVIDAAGLSGAGRLNALDPSGGLLGGGVATGPAAAERLRRLLDLVDLRRIGGGDDAAVPGGGPPVRLVVIMDAGAALEGEQAHQLLRLVEDGPRVGVPVLLVETDTRAPESVLAVRVRQSCNSLPSGEGSVGDGWVGIEWTLTPEVLPDGGDGTRPSALLAHVLGTHARGIASYD